MSFVNAGTDIQKAVQFLNKGDCVAIPTETVYGLAANALNEEAVLKIFEIKNRPYFDPLIVHTYAISEIEKYVTHIPDKAIRLFEKFSPGPLTILLPKKEIIPDLVTSGSDTVAIRIPNHPVTLQLLQQLDFPLAAPSANPFGYISPTTAQHVADQLGEKISYILDGGATLVGVESTIIGFENDEVIVFRPGGLATEEIEKVTGPLRFAVNESTNPQSPGLLKSHYAPKKKLLFNPVNKIADGAVAVIAFDKYVEGYPEENQVLLSPAADIHEAARNLFSVMRQLDKSDADIIVAVQFPQSGLGLAINDRLKRAAAL